MIYFPKLLFGMFKDFFWMFHLRVALNLIRIKVRQLRIDYILVTTTVRLVKGMIQLQLEFNSARVASKRICHRLWHIWKCQKIKKNYLSILLNIVTSGVKFATRSWKDDNIPRYSWYIIKMTNKAFIKLLFWGMTKTIAIFCCF